MRLSADCVADTQARPTIQQTKADYRGFECSCGVCSPWRRAATAGSAPIEHASWRARESKQEKKNRCLILTQHALMLDFHVVS